MLRAIETIYRGFRFRSRIEARHAIMFDELGVAWEYEAEGYNLGSAGLYLPDFWMPDLECFIEIKGPRPNTREAAVARALAEQSGFPVFIFFGQIGLTGNTSAWAFYPNGDDDTDYAWAECPTCKHLDITYGGRLDRIRCDCAKPKHGAPSGRVVIAYTRARSARFEHGERPAA